MSSRCSANRASVLTPAGRGAVAVVSVEGPLGVATADRCFRPANGRALLEQTLDRVLFGHWMADAHGEEVVLVRTGEDAVEIHCHGGVAASARITAALAAAGCEIISWGDWLGRESLNAIQIEAHRALTQATTRRAAAVLLHQQGGALQRELASVEQAISASDKDAAAQQLSRLLSRSPLGLHLTNPWQVAIAGRPNVGKSSLINALAGYQRAIVFDEPGTTRDVLSVETAIDGWPVRLTDAAGIREACDPLEAEGVARARARLQQADLVLWVFGLASKTKSTALAAAFAQVRQEAFAELGPGSNSSPSRLLVVGNKVDLLDISPGGDEDDLMLVSATNRTGLDRLLSTIAARLMPLPPRPDHGIPFTSRQVELLTAALQSLTRGDTQFALHSMALLHQGRVIS